jgi:hypothetical protein
MVFSSADDFRCARSSGSSRLPRLRAERLGSQQAFVRLRQPCLAQRGKSLVCLFQALERLERLELKDFSGEGAPVMPPPYPTKRRKMSTRSRLRVARRVESAPSLMKKDRDLSARRKITNEHGSQGLLKEKTPVDYLSQSLRNILAE